MYVLKNLFLNNRNFDYAFIITFLFSTYVFQIESIFMEIKKAKVLITILNGI